MKYCKGFRFQFQRALSLALLFLIEDDARSIRLLACLFVIAGYVTEPITTQLICEPIENGILNLLIQARSGRVCCQQRLLFFLFYWNPSATRIEFPFNSNYILYKLLKLGWLRSDQGNTVLGTSENDDFCYLISDSWPRFSLLGYLWPWAARFHAYLWALAMATGAIGSWIMHNRSFNYQDYSVSVNLRFTLNKLCSLVVDFGCQRPTPRCQRQIERNHSPLIVISMKSGNQINARSVSWLAYRFI